MVFRGRWGEKTKNKQSGAIGETSVSRAIKEFLLWLDLDFGRNSAIEYSGIGNIWGWSWKHLWDSKKYKS